MMAGFHSMMPVTGCLVAEVVSLRVRHRRVFPDWTLPLVALFGVLPDICSPHISLEDRHASFSHSLLFLAVLVPVCAMISFWFEKGMRLRVAIVTWLAAMLHLAADAASGGIPWLIPWKEEPLESTTSSPTRGRSTMRSSSSPRGCCGDGGSGWKCRRMSGN
ncbi:MAG: metal-dependent hydrolase [Luteolibacter sp.]